MVDIQSNGSKWAGEPPDTIGVLLDVLKKYPLDRRFEGCGNFIDVEKPEDTVLFFGNFLNLSHVFNIRTNKPEVIEKLTMAIRNNQLRTDYTRQAKPRKIKKH